MMKTFRAEVRQEDGQWIFQVPLLTNHVERGDRLVDVEQRVRERIAAKFNMKPSDVCIELQNMQAIIRSKERARRPAPPDILSHEWIRS